MIHVTDDFIKHLKESRDFEYSARVVLADGRVLNLSEDDLELSGCSISTAIESEEFLVGNAISQRLELAFYNPSDQYIGYDFYMAKVYPRLMFWFTDEDGETIDFGEYTVAEPEGYGTTITLSAYDALWQSDKAFDAGDLTFPITAQELYNYCCQQCNLPAQVDPIINGDYQIMKAPESVSYRQVFGFIAMLSAGNAVIRDGRVIIQPYNTDLLDRPMYDGGYFGEPAIPYTSGDDLDGGLFTGPDPVDVADAVFHGYEVHSFTEPYQGTTIGTDDVVITGVSIAGEVEIQTETIDDDGQIETTTETVEETFTFGDEGYVLQVENALFAGNYQDGVDRVGGLLVGIRFRPFEMTVPCYPIAEIGDCCYVTDYRGRQYLSFLTEVTMPFHNATTLKCSASDPVRQTANYYSNNAVVKAVKAARAEMQTVLSRYEVELNRMAGLVANALGFYETREVQPDGSVIMYMHNKVTLDGSDIIWKRTAQGLVVSTDGGRTWNAGIDAQGNAVLNMLSVKGIQWDWASGGSLTLGGVNNKYGRLNIVDANSNTIGTWNKDGISARGTIRSTSTDGSYTELTGASLITGSNNVERGAIRPGRYAASAEGPTEGMFIRATGGSFVAHGQYTPGASSTITGFLQNYGLDPDGYQQRNIFYTSAAFLNNISIRHTRGIYFLEENNTAEAAAQLCIYAAYGYLHIGGRNSLTMSKTTFIEGNLSVSGTKNRVIETKYGDVKLNAFETASCHFADVGSAEIGEDGLVYVFFDPVFAETIDQKSEYQVLITRTSEASTEWVEKCPGYFIAHGEPGATFDWMIIGYQRDYATERMERSDANRKPPNSDGEPLVNDSIADVATTMQAVENYDYTATEKILENAFEEYEKEMATL